MQRRKVLITSLTLAAAAGAISCTAATAAETPAQSSGSITIRDNGQPSRDQTRSLTVALITKNGAGNAATQPATAPEPVTEAPVEVEAPAEEPAQEAPADTAPQEGSAPEAETSAEPEVPAQETTHPEPRQETPTTGEVEVVIAPSPEPSQKAPADTADNEAPDNSEVFSTEVPIAPEDAQAHSRATSSDHAVTVTDEVGIAPQAPGAKTPKGKKGSSTQPAADAKSPASVPSAQSTAPARDELAYTGSAETGGIAIGGFMLILTGATGVWSVRRKTSNA